MQGGEKNRASLVEFGELIRLATKRLLPPALFELGHVVRRFQSTRRSNYQGFPLPRFLLYESAQHTRLFKP
jgi:hypothetical protein